MLSDTTSGELEKLLRVNVFDIRDSVQVAAEHMRARGGGGKIICAASIAGHSGFAYLGAYSATSSA